jgi:hypothetical protein
MAIGDVGGKNFGGAGTGGGAGSILPSYLAVIIMAYSAFQQQKQAKKAQHVSEESRDAAADEARKREAELKQEKAAKRAAEEKAKLTGRRVGFLPTSVGLFNSGGTGATGFGGQAAAAEDNIARGRGRLFGN